MQVRLHLDLPRDSRFVPLLRNVARSLFTDLGAPEEASEDIEIALSEACANAVRHASGSAEYTVSFTVGESGCRVDVADQGPGFVPDRGAGDMARLDDEAGRGLALMRALVDDLQFARNDDGTRVSLSKHWDGGRLRIAPGRGPSATP